MEGKEGTVDDKKNFSSFLVSFYFLFCWFCCSFNLSFEE